MAKTVKWSPASEEDFEEIVTYLVSHWSPKVADRFIQLIDENLLIIKKEPKIFPLINKQLNIRKCVITKHNTLFYRTSKDLIEIIRLFDNRQDPTTLKF